MTQSAGERTLAHKMEGAAGYIVANRLIEACSELKNNCDWLLDGPEESMGAGPPG